MVIEDGNGDVVERSCAAAEAASEGTVFVRIPMDAPGDYVASTWVSDEAKSGV